MTPSGAPTMARGRPRPPPKWTRVSIPGIFLEFSRDSRDSESEQRNSVVRHIRLTPHRICAEFQSRLRDEGLPTSLYPAPRPAPKPAAPRGAVAGRASDSGSYPPQPPASPPTVIYILRSEKLGAQSKKQNYE
jgi:hypothetical protein